MSSLTQLHRSTLSHRLLASLRHRSFLVLAWAGVLFLYANRTEAQGTGFAYDLSGNLILQTNETLGLPEILGQPQDQIVVPGELASFSVVAANSDNLFYQWRFNGTNILGATSDALLLLNVGATNQGLYSVVLTNSSGSVTSAPAALMLDVDGDGLPDSWEVTSFGNLTNTTTGDFDHDGVSNLDEYHDGTNPADAASLRFQLTVEPGGGLVTVNPNKLSYTNGEVVTLTATPFPPYIFRGWTGDTNSTNNPLTLVMNSDKTFFAHQGPENLIWTNGASGDWNVALNWNPNFVPGSNDDVTIDKSVSITINSAVDCRDLDLGAAATAPTILGTGTLTIHRDAAWLGGAMNGSGRTVIDTTATLTVTDGAVFMASRTLENRGTVLYTTSANITLSNAAITNCPGALFETRGPGTFAFNAGSGSRFDNAGTFRKSVSTGSTTFSPGNAFNNYGTVEIQTGTLNLAGGGTHTGSFDVPEGTTLNLSGGTHVSGAGSSITGAGQFIVNGATATLAGLVNVSGTNLFDGGTANLNGNYICTNNTLVISGGTANFNGTGTVTPTVVDFSSGTLGGSAVVTVLGAMNWTGGTMNGTGRTIIQPGVTLNVPNVGVVALTTRTLENRGTVLYTGSANINLSNAAITNCPGALFETRGPGTFAFNAGSGSRFDNAGTFRKSVSTGSTTFSPGNAFNNYGTVEIQTGTLNLAGGGTHTGSFDVPGGTTLNLSGGTHVSGAGSSITGAGQFIVNGATATLAGLVNVSGTNLFDGGTANLNGNYICTNNTLVISGGTANFNGTGTVTPTVVDFSSGTLGGSAVVTVLGAMNWTSGTMNGSGRTVISAGVTLNLANAGVVALTTRTLENGGTVLWTGAPTFNLVNAVITNCPGALFEARASGTFAFNGGTASRFDNAGTFRKSVSTGSILFISGNAFNNYGAVEIQTGTLSLGGGGSHSGTFDVPAGTTLSFSGGTHVSSAGSSITGAGNLTVTTSVVTLAGLVNVTGTNTVTGASTATFTGNYICTNNTLIISSGTANFNGTGTVTPAFITLSGGTLSGSQVVTVLNRLDWTLGTMSGSGRTIIPAGVTLNLANAGAVSLTTRTLENGGTVLWTGAGAINLSSSVITNRPGALFETRSSGPFSHIFGSPRFDNAGTFRKSINTGNTSIGSSIAFNNYGTVEIQSGIVVANGGYVSIASSILQCALGGTTVGTGYGRLQVTGTVNLNGSLSVNLINGFVPSTNDSFTVLTAGTRNGTFTNFYYPSNMVTMQLTNTATSVIIGVSQVLVVPRPLLLPPEPFGSDVRLTWTSVSNMVYRLEFTPNPAGTNWSALPGDVNALSNTASKLDPLTTSNRFYRVRVLP